MKGGYNMKKRIFSALLCFCLLVGLLPTAAFAEGTDEGAGTDTGKAIQIGVSQIEGAQVSSIYFGTYPQSSDGRGGYRTDPIKWRVLSNADGKPFLLSDQNLDRRQYNTTNFRVLTWEKSTIRSWLNGYGSNENSAKEDYSTNSFMNTAFSSGEQGAIAQTYVYNKTRSDGSTSPNPQHNPEGGNNTTDKVFLLSLEEVENSSYFPNGSSNRSSANTAYADYPGIRKIWWLRTPGAANITSGGGYEDVTYAAYVYTSSGNIDYDSRYGEEVHRTAFIRPAFNLDPNDVLFTSAAVGGKADAEVDGDLTAVGTAETEWKLTLKDDSRSSFEATTETTTIEAGQSLSIRYSGARTGIDEYVSVLLCDSSDNVLYYGRIARNSASGAANITIPHALVTGSYTLKVFSEQYNGNKMTDYASAFVNLPLAVTHTHQYGAGWETDEDKHWHECSCGARNGEADHAYDNEQDASCNICGYVRAFYTLTVDLKGGSGSTASGKYAKGTVIHIDAGTRADYRFTGWISSDGGSFADVSSASTTFTMPAADTTITAYWQYTGGAGQTIQIDTGGISGYDNTDGYDYIYFGNWTAQDSYTTSGPIKWRVLDDETNTGSAGLFLLSDALFGTGTDGGVYFQQSSHYDYFSSTWHKGSEPANNNHTNCRIMNAWQGSDAQSWCRDFYRSNLTAKEQGAVLATTKSDKEYSDGGSSFAAAENILSDDKLFFLSAEEATNGAYGFTDGASRVAKYGDWRDSWHLRSPYANGTVDTGVVSPTFETMAHSSAGYENPARPAFNLDLSAVLFTSAAAGGKEDTAVDGELTAVGAAGTEWKLTLKDTSRSFTAKTAATAIKTGQSLSVDYSGAQTGSNEYVSAMIADESGTIRYYGRIAQNSASGTAIVTIPSGLEKGSYTLKVFSEQYNGDYKTDYASAFVDIVLDIDPGKALQVSADGISGYDNSINGHDYDYIYYGIWDSSPVKWRVLDTKTNRENAAEGDGLFLLSDALLGTGTNGGVLFNNRVSDGNTWQGSAAQSWCNTFYSGSLTAQEQDAVLATTKSDEKFRTSISGVTFAASENILNNDRVFFLSAEEAETGAYGFTDGNARIAEYGSGAGAWWLRSPHIDYPDHAGAVSSDGSVNGSYVNFSGAARPAFNLNLDSVLFMSAAAGGKDSTAVDGSLTSVSDYNGSEWKLTLKDGSRNFAITETTAESTNGGTITLNYAGATAGTNEYISAVIEDRNGTQYYGRLKNITVDAEASGTVQLTIPGDLTDGTYTLYVFSEQYNGDYKTDYASALEEIALTVTEDTIAPKLSDGTATRDSDTTATVTFTSDEAGTYYYAVVESGETAPDIDTTGEGTACDTTEQTISLDSLTGADAKDIYIVVKDAAGNVSEKLKITIPAYTEPSYSISASSSRLYFQSQTEGYLGGEAWYVTVTNTGNQNVTVALPASTNYTITAQRGFTGDSADLAPGGTARFSVGPKTGLAAGNYDTTLNISGSNGASASIELYFTVTHNYGTDWKTDADKHWHECSCGAKADEAEHEYDDEQDTTCNVCGYERTFAPVTYTLTVDLAGGSGSTTGGEYAEGDFIQIDAGARAGYRFSGWTSSNGGSFADASSASTTFTMPAADTTITALWLDDAAPAGEIKIAENGWKTFLNDITFDLFFKDTQTVTITADDNSGEKVTIEYLLSDKALTKDELTEMAFTAYSAPFGIDPDNEYVIYAKLTDTSGNAVYINTDGMVLDATVPVISGIENGKTYCAAQTVTITEKYIDTVTVNGKEVILDSNNQFTLNPAEGTQTVVVTDKAGNETTASVTVNSGHKLTKAEAKAATCTEDGNIEYWYCDVCDKYFSDAEGKTEIALADTIIEATGHKMTKTEAKAAT